MKSPRSSVRTPFETPDDPLSKPTSARAIGWLKGLVTFPHISFTLNALVATQVVALAWNRKATQKANTKIVGVIARFMV